MSKKVIIILIIFIILSMLIIITVYKTNNNSMINANKQYLLLSTTNESGSYEAYIDSNSKNIFNEDIKLFVDINNYDIHSSYDIIYKANDREDKMAGNEKNEIDLILGEGKNKIDVRVYKNNNLEYEATTDIYYIEPYKKQFLDELSTKGVNVHYIDGTWENYNKSLELLYCAGVKYIRAGLKWESIQKSDNIFDFSKHDKWIKLANDYGINIVLNFSGMGNLVGQDKRVNTEEELKKFSVFCNNAVKQYPQIKKFELFNEPNLDYNNWLYATEKDFGWYMKSLKTLKESINNNNKNAEVLAGSSASGDLKNRSVSSKEFFEMICNNDGYEIMDSYAYHTYDILNDKNVEKSKAIEEQSKVINEYGGFIYSDITEYGVSSYSEGITEEEQAAKIVQYSIILDEYNIRIQTLYNSWNIGTDYSKKEHNFGLLHYDFTPKPSYYSIKNYYENTNGAEYIGTFNFVNGVEAHVYNKDGKPIIIVWSTNDNNKAIEYNDFEAKDMYGNRIENVDGKLNIGNEPIYLYNLNNNYFYKAISNVAMQKYNIFLEEYDTMLSSTKELQKIKNDINSLKLYMNEIGKIDQLSQEISINKMKEHFDIGTRLINLYSEGKLDIEYKELSSILDSLNIIGNTFEDLVTVSSNTNDINITNTQKQLELAKAKIDNSNDLEAVYPIKIYNFAQDFYEKANYINSLEEDNSIKNGLIVSKNQHALQLANWAEKFADIYIDKYIEENKVTIDYNNVELTNMDVEVILKGPQDMKILNNDGNASYFFKSNGEFSYQYEIRGRVFEIKANVNNIDKDKPIVENVEENMEYIEVVPKVTDKNLESVTLIHEGQVLEDYRNGDTVSIYGKYKIIAKDKAGNITEINFSILNPDEPFYCIENEYIISNFERQSLNEFRALFNKVDEEYNIYRNDELVTNEILVGTGDILKTKSNKEYIIIVKGDINKDGKVNITDIMKLKDIIVNNLYEDVLVQKAADLNNNNKINITDVMLLKYKIIY